MDDQDAGNRRFRGRGASLGRCLLGANRIDNTADFGLIADCGLTTDCGLTADSPAIVHSPKCRYLSASLKLTPARKPGSLRAFTFTVRPVNTLFTSRALCDRRSNVPNPAIVTFPPRLICREITPSTGSKIASTTRLTCVGRSFV